MLYVTTRSNADAYTAHRALMEARGSDGGQYLPFRHPHFSQEEIAALKDQTFGDTAAMLLNRLFGTGLTRWDVEFAVGRHPVRIAELSHRILVGECWHNPEWHADRVTRGLVSLLREKSVSLPGEWVQIAAGICLLFGLYGELLRHDVIEPGENVDLSAVSGEFTLPMCAWYARSWGLPIGNIVCCCNENNEIWNLICHGQLRTDTVAVKTSVPEADITLPNCLERLISSCGGPEEVAVYLNSCRRGASYFPSERVLKNIRNGLFVSVISSERLKQTIPGVWATHHYVMSPYTAMAYAGLLDYRAKKGQLRCSVVFADRSPKHHGSFVAGCLGITEAELKEVL